VSSEAPSDEFLLAVLHQTASAVGEALRGLRDWGPAGTVEGQYRHDLVADAAALEVLRSAGLGVVSEESGDHAGGSAVVVLLDPVDGSTNASRGIPWFNTSVCALDPEGARAAVVVNQVSGARFEATRGGGARCDGVEIAPSGCVDLAEAVVGLNGYPSRHLGWKQYRALGSAALDLCAVAAGILDGYVDCTTDGHAPWDYLGGMLVCREAGAVVEDAANRELVTARHADRRIPVAAATPALFAALLAARQKIG
jgi:fructose-1,6-bisphosphatase/inositol monophosphatase family enzyme